MGQNKHVVLEINKGHGQLDKTFNKEHNQSFHAICLAGISPFYTTTHNYPTAVAGHVTTASSMTTRRGPGKPPILMSYTLGHAAPSSYFSHSKALTATAASRSLATVLLGFMGCNLISLCSNHLNENKGEY